MARVITAPELALLRAAGDRSRLRLAIHVPQVIYTARVNGAPASNDMVNSINFDGATGTLADIHDGMTLYVGTTAGARDLGEVRIRKAPTSAIFYFGETSIIQWADNAYLTVVDHFPIRERAVRVDDGDILMDSDIAYSDQHEDFDPMPMLGPHIVVKMTGADVDVTLGPPTDTPSWVFDSTIDSVAWVIPDATAIDDDTAVNPIATFDTAGWHVCYCTVTALNGKSFEGLRFVYVYTTASQPVRAFKITQDPEATYDDGGWSFGIEMYDEAYLAEVRDGALCILFAEESYGSTQQSIGPVENRENIIAIGWIAGESIEWEPETNGKVQFNVQGPQYWLKQNTKYALDLSFAKNTPTTWNVMPNLSIDRAAWHLLHWRSNVSKLIDITLTNDARMSTKIKSPSNSLWDQIEDIASNKIFARPGCDRYGRLWLEVDPQMVPEADRTWPVVQTLTKKDWSDRIDVTRRTLSEVCILFASGELVNTGGSSNTLYSLAPGHMPLPYGNSDIVDGLLVSDQTQANEQAGLLMGWRNNEYPEIRIGIPQNNRMIDLWPRQYLDISITEADTERGIAYSGNLIPRSVAHRVDHDAGTLSTEIVCEAETFAAPAIDGDIPASAGGDGYDFSLPALPGLPDMPDFSDLLYLSPTAENANHPRQVVIGSSLGVLYTQNFHETTPTWSFMNNGLGSSQRSSIVKMVRTPSGAIFIFCNTGGGEIYVTSGLGGSWSLLADGVVLGGSIIAMGVNPNVTEQIAFIGGLHGAMVFYTATRSAYAAGLSAISFSSLFLGDIVFSNGLWVAICSLSGAFATPWMISFEADGSTYVSTNSANTAVGQDAAARYMVPAGTQDFIYQWDDSGAGGYNEITDGGVTFVRVTDINPDRTQGLSPSPTGTHAMATHSDGLTAPYITTDSGATWSNISGTIPIGPDVWENCRDNFRWIFGGGTTLRLTLDQGATYVDKAGNLGYIAASIDITQIRYIS